VSLRKERKKRTNRHDWRDEKKRYSERGSLGSNNRILGAVLRKGRTSNPRERSASIGKRKAY